MMAARSETVSDTKIYLRPTCFVDTPIDLDGRVERLAGGLNWFAAYELTVRQGGKRLRRDLVPVEEIGTVLTTLSDPLAVRGEAIRMRLSQAHGALTLGSRTLRLDRPHVMGILNMTPDSFSDGGTYRDDPEAAADAGFAMVEAGASIIDVGGESTRPRAPAVWEGDEIARVVPVIERLVRGGAVVSIDSRKAAVMEAALQAGAHIINDVGALLHDPRAQDVAAAADCPVVLMHAPSQGADPHAGGRYDDVAADVFDWLEQRIAGAVAAGVKRERIIVDPGLGFGKSLQENLTLANRLALFHGLGCPILFGASRKRMIGALSREEAAPDRLGGSIVLAMQAVAQGAQIVRVHDVRETVQAIAVWRGLRDAALVVG